MAERAGQRKWRQSAFSQSGDSPRCPVEAVCTSLGGFWPLASRITSSMSSTLRVMPEPPLHLARPAGLLQHHDAKSESSNRRSCPLRACSVLSRSSGQRSCGLRRIELHAAECERSGLLPASGSLLSARLPLTAQLAFAKRCAGCWARTTGRENVASRKRSTRMLFSSAVTRHGFNFCRQWRRLDHSHSRAPRQKAPDFGARGAAAGTSGAGGLPTSVR